MPRNKNQTSPRRLAALEKQQQALQLRLAGASFDVIARQLGYGDKSGAYRAVQSALKRIPAPEVEDYRKVNLERLNRMRLKNWPKVMEGDLKAMQTELAIQERETRYLGLDAPARHELSGPDGGPIPVLSVMDLVRLAAEYRRGEVAASLPALLSPQEGPNGDGGTGL